MSFRILLIAAAALLHSCCCLADVATINDAAAQEVLLPFNDLLPPLFESTVDSGLTTSTLANSKVTKSTTTTVTPLPTTPTTTTTIAPTTAAVTHLSKPTKKSYYQQQQAQQNKDLHLIDNERRSQQPKATDNQQANKDKDITKQHELQSLSLDLLPPFEDAATTTQTTIEEAPKPIAKVTKQNTLQAPVKYVAKFAATKAKPKHVAKPLSQTQHVAREYETTAAATQRPQQHVELSSDVLQHYANYYYQQTTRRPLRGPLPTLTPFPRHFK